MLVFQCHYLQCFVFHSVLVFFNIVTGSQNLRFSVGSKKLVISIVFFIVLILIAKYTYQKTKTTSPFSKDI